MIKKIFKPFYWILYIFCVLCIFWAIAPDEFKPECSEKNLDWSKMTKNILFGRLKSNPAAEAREKELKEKKEKEENISHADDFEQGKYVYDFASILNSSELESRLKTFKENSSVQIVVVSAANYSTDSSMTNIEYATNLAQLWGIGEFDKDNGVMIIIKPKINESAGHATIVTGYGMEGTLPDIVCHEIVQNSMIPLFEQGKYDEGVEAAVNMISAAIRKEKNGDKEIKLMPNEHVADFAFLIKNETHLDYFEKEFEKLKSEHGVDVRFVTVPAGHSFIPEDLIVHEGVRTCHESCNKNFIIWMINRFSNNNTSSSTSPDILVVISGTSELLGEKERQVQIFIKEGKDFLLPNVDMHIKDLGSDDLYNAMLNFNIDIELNDIELNKIQKDINLDLYSDLIIFFIILMFVHGSIELVSIYLNKMNKLQQSLIEEEADKLREKGWGYKIRGAFYFVLMLPAILIGKIFGGGAKTSGGGRFGGGGATGSW